MDGAGKVLRLGVVRDGELLEDRQVPRGQGVSVPSREAPLLLWDDGHYVLHLRDGMTGKLKLDGRPVDVRELGAGTVRLGPDDRGKIEIDGDRILFRFVSAPPPAALRLEQLDFRPPLLEDDDRGFVAVLSVALLLGTTLAGAVYNTPPPVLDVGLPDLSDFARQKVVIVVPTPTPDPDPTPPPKPLGTGTGGGGGRSADAVVDADPAPSSGARTPLSERSVLAQRLGSLGEHTRGEVVNPWSRGGGALAEKMAALEGSAEVSAFGSRRGTLPGPGDRVVVVDAVDLDDAVTLDKRPIVPVTPTLTMQEPELEDAALTGIGRVVQRYGGQLRHCFEKRLKEVPSLAGRVSLELVVSGEAVEEAVVVTNTTHDDAFAACIEARAARWKLVGVADGVARIPYVFEAVTSGTLRYGAAPMAGRLGRL